MKYKILLTFAVIVFNAKAQTLNPTVSIQAANTADNFRGGYTFAYATSGTPWNGSLISFGGFDNNYDTQISADYGPHGGNHISFRTKNGDIGVWNPWIELATKAQTLNQTVSIQAANTADNFTSGYTFAYATSGTPWNGSLISFGGFDNNYDTQISADYGPNGGNHISFRTKNGDAGIWNPWIELATKGDNTFSGHQIINGNITSSIASNEGGFLSLINPTKTASDISNTWRIYNMTGSYGNSLQFWSYINNGTGGSKMTLTDNGNVGIGTVNPAYKLDVIGTIRAREVKVNLQGADFVFEDGYRLMPLNELEKFVKQNKHLPEIAPAKEMQEKGSDLGNLSVQLLQKIEELTLHAIEQNKKMNLQNKEMDLLKEKMRKLEQK
ncbi:MAG TPA: hypothetical protein VF677_11145 [Flavobacterium sp.]|jgi:hypothetical protein